MRAKPQAGTAGQSAWCLPGGRRLQGRQGGVPPRTVRKAAGLLWAFVMVDV